ncbi:MAG: hypothetical protein MPJ22_09390, partial [Pirellulales bacterium]|nr:hypothetical protein [Pirellulales bacterium]
MFNTTWEVLWRLATLPTLINSKHLMLPATALALSSGVPVSLTKQKYIQPPMRASIETQSRSRLH